MSEWEAFHLWYTMRTGEGITPKDDLAIMLDMAAPTGHPLSGTTRMQNLSLGEQQLRAAFSAGVRYGRRS